MDSIALAVLLGLLPALSVAQLHLMEGVQIERIPAYVSSAITLVVLGGGCLLVGIRKGGPAAVGLVSLSPASLAGWGAGLAMAGLALMLAFRRMATGLGLREARVLRELLPRTSRERWIFGGLSLAAGLGEEMAYRGYALTVLAGVVGTGVAAVVTSLVFGVLHAYQGGLGMLRACALGGILAWGFLAAGSLWPAMVAHALLDVMAGIVLAERLMVPEARVGVSG
jgi:membrane protease YdiL (CAAX protease family)